MEPAGNVCVCVGGVRGRDTYLCWASGSEILEMPV